jgi:hypothetical protein
VTGLTGRLDPRELLGGDGVEPLVVGGTPTPLAAGRRLRHDPFEDAVDERAFGQGVDAQPDGRFVEFFDAEQVPLEVGLGALRPCLQPGG